MDVRLTAGQETFLTEAVQRGRFPSAEVALSEAVDLLLEQEQELERFRAAIEEGDAAFENGGYTDYTDATLPELFEGVRR